MVKQSSGADMLTMNRWMRRRYNVRRKKLAAAGTAYLTVMASRELRNGARGKLKTRQRMNWLLRLSLLDDVEFVQRYRLDKASFKMVVDRIREDVEPHRKQSQRAGGGATPITTELQLSMVLRYCAGGAWQDIVDMHGVSRASFRNSIEKVTPLACIHIIMLMTRHL